jgi:hypothetical protein
MLATISTPAYTLGGIGFLDAPMWIREFGAFMPDESSRVKWT